MNQRKHPGALAPAWGLRAVLCVCALVAPAAAQPDPKSPPADKSDKSDKSDKGKKDDKKAAKDQVFNFEGLGLAGKNRSPQLLYFLERANEELERASLQKRSFIPHIVRSVEEEQL